MDQAIFINETSMKRITRNEAKKREFRLSRQWKEFRKHIAEKFNYRDPVSFKRLRKGYSVHHLDLDPDNYENLVEENFIPLNKLMHAVLHICYDYQKNDREFMDRLRMWVDKMVETNN